MIVVTPRPARARALLEEIREWLPAGASDEVLSFPARESLPYERRRAPSEAGAERLRVLAALAAGSRPLIVTDVQALAQGTLRPGPAVAPLRRGASVDAEALLRALDAGGYRREAVVDGPGTLTRRGGIIDVFPPTDELPLRIELFGSEIESLRRFDPATQRSVGRVESASLGPAGEARVEPEMRALAGDLLSALSREDGTSARLPSEADVPGLASDLERLSEGEAPVNTAFWTAFLAGGALWEHLPGDTRWVWEEADECRRHAEELDDLAERTRASLEARGSVPPGLPLPHRTSEALFAAVAGRRPRVDLRRFAAGGAPGEATPGGQGAQRLRFGPVEAFGARLRQLMDRVRGWRGEGRRTVIVSLQSPRLAELFEGEGIPASQEAALSSLPGTGAVRLIRGSIPHGWALPAEGGDVVLLSDTEVFGFAKQRRRRGRPRRQHESFLEDLQPGDYVVHIEHGIGRFTGIARQSVGEREREYLELRYADEDRLLVPTDQLHRLQRYVGPSDHAPVLTRLGTQQWSRAKQRVRASVRALAEDLLQLYAARQVLPGLAAGPDTPWQMELEASFPYVETPDQLDALREVKLDMERDRPMDRIVVGDVGYGKTEVAVRAAFKAIADGRQVAMLVPTTVLAQQHVNTVHERTAAFPIRVEMLSRFRSPAEQRQVLAGLADGSVDMVIGTHRLLQTDVAFKSLGLVVIDEEQRFGVAHKERLKRMRREVDVLTLSATPIPRTLHMALSAIRDMSTIETPPEERLPITTYVMETDDQVVREAILREIERGGQVYFLHNRVRTIEVVAGWLRELVPEGRFVVGHGQMPEGAAGGGDDVVRGGRRRRAGLHDDHRVGARHPQRQHDHHPSGAAAGAGATLPTAGAGGSQRGAGLRLPALRPLAAAGRGGAEALADDLRRDGAGGGLPDRAARPGDPRHGQPAGRRAERPDRRGGLRAVHATAGRERRGAAGDAGGPAAEAGAAGTHGVDRPAAGGAPPGVVRGRLEQPAGGLPGDRGGRDAGGGDARAGRAARSLRGAAGAGRGAAAHGAPALPGGAAGRGVVAVRRPAHRPATGRGADV